MRPANANAVAVTPLFQELLTSADAPINRTYVLPAPCRALPIARNGKPSNGFGCRNMRAVFAEK
jgi:hypothetical protein